MAAELTESVFLNEDNSFDVAFTVNGVARTDAITRITAHLYEVPITATPPIVLDSDVVAEQGAFNYSDPSHIIFSWGRLTKLAGKQKKSFQVEVRLYDLDNRSLKVTSVKNDSSLPTLTVKVWGKPEDG